MSFFLKGLILGFSIAAPVGPIAILCIHRTLTQGRLSGLITGLGAATADAFYGCIAGLGLTIISDFIIEQQIWMRLFGGLFLCYLGIKTFINLPAHQLALTKETSLLNAYASTLFLTLTNPITILSFAAIFAGLGIVSIKGNYTAALILVFGVFIGSLLWWLLLSLSISSLRTKLTQNQLKWINRVSGFIITLFGVTILATLNNFR